MRDMGGILPHGRSGLQNAPLKGAMLMTTWFNDPLRPTRDIDLLGFGIVIPILPRYAKTRW